jgi:hypothetical protein
LASVVQRYLLSPFIDLADVLRIADRARSRSRQEAPGELPIWYRIRLRQAARAARTSLTIASQDYALLSRSSNFARAW